MRTGYEPWVGGAVGMPALAGNRWGLFWLRDVQCVVWAMAPALLERVCACVRTRVCGVVCVLGSRGFCCLAEELSQRPDLLLVCWRLWRQLLLLAPGLRCGRLNFLLLASGRQAATGCLRQGLPSECWRPLPGRCAGGCSGSLQGRQWPCSPIPTLPATGCLRGGPNFWRRGFCVGRSCSALLWSPASSRKLFMGWNFRLSPQLNRTLSSPPRVLLIL